MRFVIILGIAALFPITVYYGVAALTDRPTAERWDVENDLASGEESGLTMAERRKKILADFDAAQTRFGMLLFWIATPTAVLAILSGPFIPVRTIGIGLPVGGGILLVRTVVGVGDAPSDILRFLALLLGLGAVGFVAWYVHRNRMPTNDEID